MFVLIIMSWFINPFMDNMELFSLSSGLISTEQATADMLKAEFKGETGVLKFIDERLVKQSVNFFNQLNWLKLRSFATILKKTVKIKFGKVVQCSSQSDIW